MTSSIENEYVKFWIDNDILFCYYKETNLIDLKAAKEIVEHRKKVTNGFSYPCLADISMVKQITKEARGYLADEENSTEIVKAALIVQSFFTRVLANFFLLIDKPKTPCRVFNSKEEAVNWLKLD